MNTSLERPATGAGTSTSTSASAGGGNCRGNENSNSDNDINNNFAKNHHATDNETDLDLGGETTDYDIGNGGETTDYEKDKTDKDDDEDEDEDDDDDDDDNDNGNNERRNKNESVNNNNNSNNNDNNDHDDDNSANGATDIEFGADGTRVTKPKRTRPKHVLVGVNSTDKEEQKSDPKELKQKCVDFILKELAPNVCPLGPGHPFSETTCHCLGFLLDPGSAELVDHVSDYMVHWETFDKRIKKEIVGEWLRVSRLLARLDKRRCFMLPMLERANKIYDGICICKNALCNLLNISKRAVEFSLRNPARKKPHGLKGRRGELSNSAKIYSDVRSSLRQFFDTLIEEGQNNEYNYVNENSQKVIVLPPGVSKHNMYSKWSWDRGWKLIKRCRATTLYARIAEHEKRPHDDHAPNPQWPTGSEPKQIITWSAFRNFWNEYYPNLKVYGALKKKLNEKAKTNKNSNDKKRKRGDIDDDDDEDDEDDDDAEEDIQQQRAKEEQEILQAAATNNNNKEQNAQKQVASNNNGNKDDDDDDDDDDYYRHHRLSSRHESHSIQPRPHLSARPLPIMTRALPMARVQAQAHAHHAQPHPQIHIHGHAVAAHLPPHLQLQHQNIHGHTLGPPSQHGHAAHHYHQQQQQQQQQQHHQQQQQQQQQPPHGHAQARGPYDPAVHGVRLEDLFR